MFPLGRSHARSRPLVARVARLLLRCEKVRRWKGIGVGEEKNESGGKREREITTLAPLAADETRREGRNERGGEISVRIAASSYNGAIVKMGTVTNVPYSSPSYRVDIEITQVELTTPTTLVGFNARFPCFTPAFYASLRNRHDTFLAVLYARSRSVSLYLMITDRMSELDWNFFEV